jgi:uncharacterized membrane protein
MHLFIASFAAIGVILIVLAVPLMRRRVKPNDRYGLRLAATFADQWVWYEANACSGRDLFVLGVAVISVAILPPLLIPLTLGISGLCYIVANVVVLGVGIIVVAAIGCSRAERLLRARRAATGRT